MNIDMLESSFTLLFLHPGGPISQLRAARGEPRADQFLYGADGYHTGHGRQVGDIPGRAGQDVELGHQS